MATVVYPFDDTGQADTNLVLDERHTLTSVNSAPRRILLPKFAPFYVNKFKAIHLNPVGDQRELTQSIDFDYVLYYAAASRSTGKAVYGGIVIKDEGLNGSIILEYQTVGGKWCADTAYVYQRLLETVYNKRTTWWDDITNVQDIFPPTTHQMPIEDVMGVEELKRLLEGISEAILKAPESVPARYIEHLLLSGNVHNLQPADLGIKNSAMLEIATDQEVFELEPVDKVVTLRQLVQLFRR